MEVKREGKNEETEGNGEKAREKRNGVYGGGKILKGK